MSNSGMLAQRVDYRRLAAQRGVIEGTLDVKALPRVAAQTAAGCDAGYDIRVALAFDEDAQRRAHVSGRIITTLPLICQRCLATYEQPLDAAVAAVVVADDTAAANVPRAVEPALADGDRLDVYALVADELLLAWPVVARCARPDCTARFAGPRTGEAGAKRPDNPFAVLRDLAREH